ncbi:1-phosphatidylinositol phosphodiesterase [Patella vulgata]|uniref:1-phosphatidylinositol phosphodiesterase n=1 Tax=Patella vulgata TaxID=6465 RepID=UPI0024A917F3|nr:1-phosphatidylinositol phosphodiesterase [Patella vulgata]XP_050403003.2 1-phosphatidylinositol phosphodiesterase [Patella vulgata]
MPWIMAVKYILTFIWLVGFFSKANGVSAAIQIKYYSTASTTSLDNHNWISRIPNSRAISDMSIPGTHNTVSFFGGPYAQCQTLPLLEQYKAGIRFVDIRCRHIANELPIYHGIMYQNIDLYGVINDTVQFLNQNPEELILMRIREESAPRDSTQSMTTSIRNCINSYPQHRFWHSVTWPTLGQARGKIIILQQFDTHHYIWVPYRSMNIEDHWNVRALSRRHLLAKWRHVKTHLKRISGGTDDNRVHLAYTSGSSFMAFPYAVAMRQNRNLWKFFRQEESRHCARYGIIGMDFPGDVLINQIIEKNFRNGRNCPV